MDYEEFCNATGNSYELLQQVYSMNEAIGQATNRKLMRDLRIYMAVGGMPQAVEAYVEGKNFSDIGLFVTLMFIDRPVTENDVYAKLLSDKLPANLGYLYENLVAQMIVASGRELYYHTWEKKSSTHYYEVDFLVSQGRIDGDTDTAKILKLDGYVTTGLVNNPDIVYPYQATCEQYISERIHRRSAKSI